MSGRSDLDVKLTLLHLYGVLVGPIIWIAILSVRCVKCTPPPRFFASQMGVMPLILTYVAFIIRHCFKRTLNVCIYKYIFTQFQQKTGETKTISMREARQITQKKNHAQMWFSCRCGPFGCTETPIWHPWPHLGLDSRCCSFLLTQRKVLTSPK